MISHRMNRTGFPRRRILRRFLGLWVVAGFLGAAPASGADIKVVGSSTVFPIAKKAAPLFRAATGIGAQVKGGGSGVGVRAVRDGSADVGMVSRALKPEEERDLAAFTIGRDGVAVIVNSENPVRELNREQIQAVFSGAVVNWKALGGRDREIVVVAKASGRSTKAIFERFFSLQGKVTPSAHCIGSNAEAIVFVAGDPAAIGYVSIGDAERARALGIHIRPLPLEGVPATGANLASGRYPLRRPLNLVVRRQVSRKPGVSSIS